MISRRRRRRPSPIICTVYGRTNRGMISRSTVKHIGYLSLCWKKKKTPKTKQYIIYCNKTKRVLGFRKRVNHLFRFDSRARTRVFYDLMFFCSEVRYLLRSLAVLRVL